MLKTKYINQLLVIFYCLSSIYFYRPVSVDLSILKGLYLFFLFCLIATTIHKSLKGKTKDGNLAFKFPMGLLVFSIIFSAIPAWISWNQSMFESLIALVPYLGYLLYFFLIKTRPTILFLEKLVIRLGTATFVILLLSVLLYPNVLFGAKDEETISLARGFARVAIPGMGFMFLSYFISLNRYLVTKDRNYLLYSILFLIGIFITLTRQTIVGCVLLGIYFLIKSLKGIGWKVLIISSSLGLLLYIINLEFVQNLILITKDQSESFDSDIRVVAAKYFLFDFSPDFFATLFGNGEPTTQLSYYGNFMNNLKINFGFFQSDLGFIGMYSKFGILSVLSWILIYIRLFKHRLHAQSQYINYYMLLVLITGLTGSFMININHIGSICIALYIADKSIQKKHILKI